MTSTKHILNDQKDIAIDCLKGVAIRNPKLLLNEEYKVITRRQFNKNHVTLLSGGGIGHEPSHTGFVGEGILTGAVCGNFFASPNTNQVKKCLETIDTEKGVLMVVPQYTGDVLHFGLAKEQYLAAHPNSKLRVIFVGEDVSVGRSQGKMVGRRGLAGVVLVYKIAGALAATGADLDACYDVAKFVMDSTATLGMGLDHCHIPGTGGGEHTLAADEMELGMGIHNEPGIKRIKIPSTRELLEQMLTFVTDITDPDRSFVPFKHDGKDEVVLMLNNLGGVSELEMNGIIVAATEICKEKGITVRRLLTGAYVTSLNMPGFSVSLLRLPREGESAYSSVQILELVDAPADSHGWHWFSKSEPAAYERIPKETKVEHHIENVGKKLAPPSSEKFIQAIQQACKDVVAAEPEITRFDTIAGDGDCGLCLQAGGEGLLKLIADGKVSDSDIVTAILQLAEQIEVDMDGTSGALYSIFFNGLGANLRAVAEEKGADVATPEVWAEALTRAKAVLFQYTRARKPSRTLVDPLEAFVTTFAAAPSDFAGAVKAAVDAAAETARVEAKAGRAAYVSREELAKAAVPDPGAHGVGIILQGILNVLQG